MVLVQERGKNTKYIAVSCAIGLICKVICLVEVSYCTAMAPTDEWIKDHTSIQPTSEGDTYMIQAIEEQSK